MGPFNSLLRSSEDAVVTLEKGAWYEMLVLQFSFEILITREPFGIEALDTALDLQFSSEILWFLWFYLGF